MKELLTMKDIAVVNLQRCERWHKLTDWSLSDWATALAGEVGELCNVIKKLNRVRDGLRGNKESPEELRIALGKEIADSFLYLDLLAQRANVDLGAAVIAKFNEVSERLGFPERLPQERPVLFYGGEWYCFSNFSAFMVQFEGLVFPTSEHAYQWSKFPEDPLKQSGIRFASSAHAAFKLAERWRPYRTLGWEAQRVDIMRNILRAKVEQHEYVRHKLLSTGSRQIIEDSWRDSFWGWGEHGDGANMLGKLWMDLRSELQRSEAEEKR